MCDSVFKEERKGNLMNIKQILFNFNMTILGYNKKFSPFLIFKKIDLNIFFEKFSISIVVFAFRSSSIFGNGLCILALR